MAKLKAQTLEIIERAEKFNWGKPPFDPDKGVEALQRRAKCFDLKLKFKVLDYPVLGSKLVHDPANSALWDGSHLKPDSAPDRFQEACSEFERRISVILWGANRLMLRQHNGWFREWRPVVRDVRILAGLVETLPAKGRGDATNLLDVFSPMMEAFEAGMFAWAFASENEVHVLRCPQLHRNDERQLHGEGMPCLTWGPKAERFDLFCWKGIEVPRHAIMEPGKITLDEIAKAGNQETRRALMECYGLEKYVNNVGTKIGEDEYGSLWRRPESNVANVLVCENGTVEKDGTRKRFALMVPNTCRTPLEAGAWAYAMTPAEYKALRVRT